MIMRSISIVYLTSWGRSVTRMVRRMNFIELDSIVFVDRGARRRYLRYCRMHSALRLELRAHRATQAACQQIGVKSTATESSELDVAKVSPVSPTPTLLSTTFHTTLGYFPEGMPLAYLIATVVTGLGLLVGSHIYMSSPEQVARQSVPLASPLSPLPSVVGRITGMVDCQWNGGSRVSLGQKIALASGLLEITYDTGAKVILQGPVTYSVEANGGYLAVGKLTGKLEARGEGREERGEIAANHQVPNPKSQIVSPSPLSPLLSPLFVIRTPTATVTDLGTEFGIEVSRNGTTGATCSSVKCESSPEPAKVIPIGRRESSRRGNRHE